MLITPRDVEIRHFHLFCGLGGGARGFNRGRARVGHTHARFRCLGGVDSDAAAVRDFERLAGARGTVLDLFDREQYVAWHGREPGEGWREASSDDIRRAAGGERPNIIFTSPPCKGFSGLLAQERAAGARYQALNRLALRGVWLALEAWADDPPELFLLENVPRIAQRGRHLVDAVTALLNHHGYAVAETAHDCGELGGLAQSRKRFLLVARHQAKVPPFLYEPPKRRLRAVGDVIGKLPLPGATSAGPMHALRPLQWKTWVRLAFVEAGSDWRSLQRLRVVDGRLADFGIAPERVWHRGALGVLRFDEPAGTVTGCPSPTAGSFSVADPRCAWSASAHRNKLKVVPYDATAGTVIGAKGPDGGACSVADPVPAGWREYGQLGVLPFDRHAGTVSGQSACGGGWYSVADPRLSHGPAGPHFNNVYRVVRFDQAAGAVTAGASPSAGGQAVADPRCGLDPARQAYRTGGHYGVLAFGQTSGAVTGAARLDSGPWSIADPRLPPAEAIDPVPGLPVRDEKLVAVIRALDGTWHRPFTTLELAALQSLIDPEETLSLDGASDTAHRERIGNAVPPDAAAAIASEMGRTLLLAWSGETFALSDTPVWVRPVAIALSVQPGGVQ